jgi:hypothetical protein
MDVIRRRRRPEEKINDPRLYAEFVAHAAREGWAVFPPSLPRAAGAAQRSLDRLSDFVDGVRRGREEGEGPIDAEVVELLAQYAEVTERLGDISDRLSLRGVGRWGLSRRYRVNEDARRELLAMQQRAADLVICALRGVTPVNHGTRRFGNH